VFVYREARAAELRIADLLGPRRLAQLRDAVETLAGRIARKDLPSSMPGATVKQPLRSRSSR
jgi:hypothetical protein